METKHTPGPWQVSGVRQRGGDWYGHPVGPDGFNIALVAYSDRKPGEHVTSLADARLIAAAPDLLEALQTITDCAEAGSLGVGMDLWVKHARAAIAKAEGR
jgi:hypothetical protein